jgi:hypothetical protein
VLSRFTNLKIDGESRSLWTVILRTLYKDLNDF